MTLGWEELSQAVKKRDAFTIVQRLPEIEKCLRASPRLTRKRVEDEILGNKRLVLRPCSFPYDVEAHHYILWVRDEITHAEAWKRLRKRIQGEFLLHENKIGFRSVPHTQHYHVFLRTQLT